MATGPEVDGRLDGMTATPCTLPLDVQYYEKPTATLKPLFKSDVASTLLHCERIMDFQEPRECISGRDFISRLPDDILVHILSCLKTKDAVNGRPLLNEVFLDVRLVKDYFILDGFEVSHDEANRVMKLLRGVNYTKILSLTSNTTNSLNLGFDDNMPTFPNLIRLEMCIDARFGWKLLPHFLNSSSNLEILILEMVYGEEYSPEEFVQFESESVPSCLRLHVKMIEIRNMVGYKDELEMISYMLKNSEVLEEFSVEVAAMPAKDATSKENLRRQILMEPLRQILMYPRGSVACEIKCL
ncbi:hypothetical protein LWI29_001570 [Acer saccharum]|uniref:FBD domain-containing protein n=1 Tax=Acer saccharum TaxID=4024 RepID=A0AA39VYJ7_ACESA|nr:hypothetical protein LWI29_001570 [Acer saccharum]